MICSLRSKHLYKTKITAALFNERGEELICSIYAMLVFLMILFISIDVIGYTSMGYKLRNVCSQTLALMRMQNGMNSALMDRFQDCALIYGIDISRTEVAATPQYVQRGEEVSIRASTPYKIKCMRPFNQEYSVMIDVEMTGIAEDFIRELQ